MERGFFISFEGIEGCGKSTHIKLLKDYMLKKGLEVLITREPGGTVIGEKIRDILLDKDHSAMTSRCEFLLFLASRNQHVREIIAPALARSKIVLSDRFLDSSTAYQGWGREITISDAMKLNQFAIEGYTPDITFILDVTVKEAIKRVISRRRKLDRFESEKVKFYKKVRDGYLKLAALNKKRIVIIDGSGSVEETQKKIRNIVNKRLTDGANCHSEEVIDRRRI